MKLLWKSCASTWGGAGLVSALQHQEEDGRKVWVGGQGLKCQPPCPGASYGFPGLGSFCPSQVIHLEIPSCHTAAHKGCSQSGNPERTQTPPLGGNCSINPKALMRPGGGSSGVAVPGGKAFEEVIKVE